MCSCAESPVAVTTVAATPIESVWLADDYRYRLAPGDSLGVRFLLSPDLNTQITIGPDGRAVLPYVSGVHLAGLTVEQADAAVSQAYRAYLRQPSVELLVYTYAGGQIYVAGEVKTPGAKAIHGETRLLQAIIDAGGFADTAKVDAVAVLRRRPNGQVLMRTFNVNSLLAGRTGADFQLLPGDVVFVPRSTIAEVDRIVRQYISGVLPFNLDYQLSGNAATAVVH